MTEKEKIDLGLAAYFIGMLSIVVGVFQPFSGIVLGIVGLITGKKDNTVLSKRGQRLSTIGIIVSIIILILTVVLAYTLQKYASQIGFPTY